MDVDGVNILAHGITAVGPLGTAFENIDLRIEPGALAVVAGASGTGRTALLLTLSGRLRIIAGHLDVSGYVLPEEARTVRKLITPARVRPGFELEPQHSVHEAIRERCCFSRVSPEAVEDAFALADLDPEPSALVGELHPGDQLLFAIALAAADGPAGMLVDDVEAGLPRAARARVWTALRAVAERGTTVLVSTTDAPFGDDITVVRLPSDPPGTPTRTLPVAESPGFGHDEGRP